MLKQFAAALAIATLPGAALAVTIDFETFAGQPVVGSGPTAGVDVLAGTDLGGLSFDADIRIGQFGFADGPATDNFIAIKKDGLFNPKTFDVTGIFTRLVTSLTLGAGDACCDTDNVSLAAYDAFGNVVDSASFTGQDSQFLTVSGAGIKSFYLSPISGGFDNISFSPVPVPLPASLPLLAAALFGFGLLRRRRH